MLTHLDLFSGVGGFAIAAQAAGFQTIAFCEIDPYCQAILQEHWPDVPNYGDINALIQRLTGMSANQSERLNLGEVSLITAGVPCQPASVAGKRLGLSDDRWLWPATFAVIRTIHPAWLLLENVPGILTLEQGVVFEHLCLALEGFGYAVQPLVIPACAVDAKHRRDRVWIVAHADSQRGRRRNTERQDARHAGESPCTWKDERVWFAESGMGRVAHGIPNRAHRLRALGNAIVPQVAQVILQEIAHLHA